MSPSPWNDRPISVMLWSSKESTQVLTWSVIASGMQYRHSQSCSPSSLTPGAGEGFDHSSDVHPITLLTGSDRLDTRGKPYEGVSTDQA